MNIILDSIYRDIEEISDLELQRKLWLDTDNSIGRISSFADVINRLFDGNAFEYFLEKEAIGFGLDEDLVFELTSLKDMLNNYCEKSTDLEIINDPQWKVIVEKAAQIIKLWKEKRVDLL